MEEASAIAIDGVLGDVGTGDEALGVRAGGSDKGIPDGVLTEELRGQAVEHVSKEAHVGMARDGAVMVEVHGEFWIYGVENICVVEIVEDVEEDDGAISLPSIPGVRSCEVGKICWGLNWKCSRVEIGGSDR